MCIGKWLWGAFVSGAGVVMLAGCSNFPTVPTGSSGAIGQGSMSAAHLSQDDSILASLVGGERAGAKYLVGADWSMLKNGARQQASAAVRKAEISPASAADVARSRTADLNNDGFITLDEVIAMRQAGLSEQQMVDRIDQSHQYFEVTAAQQKYLKEQAVPGAVVSAMDHMNLSNVNEARTAAATIGPDEQQPVVPTQRGN